MEKIVLGNTTIKAVRLVPNINWKDEYEMWIDTDGDFTRPETKAIDIAKDGTLYYGEDNGLACYYFIEANDKTEYHWSSRSSVVNMFLQDGGCMETAINSWALAITIDKAQEILDKLFSNQYQIVRRNPREREIKYTIVKK